MGYRINLQERLKDLKELLQLEQSSEKPSDSYIEDLKMSIMGVEAQLRYMHKGPEIINVA